jgi:micrococcal nuclease
MPTPLAPATRLFLSKVLSFVVACFFAMALTAAEFGAATVASVRTVYDGDTFRVNISDWPAVVGESMPVRIKGVDTPELRAKCQSEKDAARAAKQLSVARLGEGSLLNCDLLSVINISGYWLRFGLTA